ncbi:MAG TPA: DUF5709 domain-containing protein [Streptosporangiaceae bacterium]
MTSENPHESEDLEDYEVEDSSDTLSGAPGDDPLDRGVVPPERWTGAIRRGDQGDRESLDELLAEEEPDVGVDVDDEDLEDIADDEDAGDEDVDGLLLDDGPDPRAGRLVAPDEGSHPVTVTDLLARDAGIDGGGATAEEAAMHVVEEDDYDIRSDDE